MPDSTNGDKAITMFMGVDVKKLTSQEMHMMNDYMNELLAQYLESIKLPEKKELVPNGYSERVGYNQALEDTQAIINQHIERLRK